LVAGFKRFKPEDYGSMPHLFEQLHLFYPLEFVHILRNWTGIYVKTKVFFTLII